ncbi:glutathione S-transferase family protein [Bordetella bronchialis]|uniref:Glutathione S-transferase n=1 Tax=Bordetella bronchialis TaxID=463025 RepID=A0A193FRF5_9BORD|nr:glutathione S-transferase [Bordetella bronchialis]ANN70332.1 glutathione S-transferase [Bordetella bronchialis]
MKFHYSPGSCALAVHIALEEAGAQYDAQRVHFDRQEQRSPEYLRLNPLGRVPVLETPDGVLTEVIAILAYVAAAYPRAALAPADAFGMARMMSFNSFLSSSVHVAYAHHTRGARWSDDPACQASMAAKVPANYVALFDMIEAGKLGEPWVMGQQYTVADPYLYVMTRWLERLDIDVNRFPRIATHHRRMNERPAVQRALRAQGLAAA